MCNWWIGTTLSSGENAEPVYTTAKSMTVAQSVHLMNADTAQWVVIDLLMQLMWAVL